MSLDALAIVRRQLITDQKRKVDYLNTLRSIVARRCPVNKVGAAIVSDYDLLDATTEETTEALAKIQPKPSAPIPAQKLDSVSPQAECGSSAVLGTS